MEIQQPLPDTQGEKKDIKADRVLNLVLGKNDKVYWYIGMPGSKTSVTDYSSSGVRKLLSEKGATIKGLYVFIKASDQSRYQNMIDVLDEVMITNTVNYALLDLEPEDTKLIH